jgi:carbon-monoxide dehydrogenase small subunit
MDELRIELTVDGERHELTAEPRETLAEALRERCGALGVRIGCGEGHCGACTVDLDGATARACTVLAVQVDGATVRTVEDLAAADGTLHPLQEAFAAEHALQCGFCTAGMLMSAEELLRERPDADDDAIRAALSGSLCRCTGYQGILRAVRRARDVARDGNRQGEAR